MDKILFLFLVWMHRKKNPQSDLKQKSYDIFKPILKREKVLFMIKENPNIIIMCVCVYIWKNWNGTNLGEQHFIFLVEVDEPFELIANLLLTNEIAQLFLNGRNKRKLLIFQFSITNPKSFQYSISSHFLIISNKT